ncbi:MAG: type VI secretion protein ImpB [Burkholderiales bacterium]|nr:type VI secretion protein ImpB [Phycisphaerae bacterium]
MNWLFTDMNAYFASVEQHDRTDLQGRPIGVIPVESEGTCVIAASYDAKRFGVKVGTRVSDARQMCRGIILVRARPQRYVEVHHAILRSIERCAPVHKVYSIDEWSIRLIGREQEPEQAAALARMIKRQLLKDFSPYLTCSIGIAPTRLLAKIASDFEKPDGLTILPISALPDQLESWSLKDLAGIGGGICARLNQHGIHTIRDLWAISKQQAMQIWGSITGADWWAGFHGIDEPEIQTRRHSMSHANVLALAFRNDRSAYGILVRLICRLGARLRHDGYYAQGLSVHVKDVRGGYFADSSLLPFVHDTPTLLSQFHKLWQRRGTGHFAPLKVGADVTGLVPVNQVEDSLFDEIEKPRRISHAIDTINRRWGKSAIYFGPMHDFRHHMDDKIAFGRIPSLPE